MKSILPNCLLKRDFDGGFRHTSGGQAVKPCRHIKILFGIITQGSLGLFVISVSKIKGKTMRILIPALAMAVITGCVSVADGKIESQSGSISVPLGTGICIIFPEDGKFEGKAYKDSGLKVGEIIQGTVAKHYQITNVSSLEACDKPYIVTSEIKEYENRASGWSGIPDKIRVSVTITNTENNEASSFTYYADSNMAASAFLEWGNAAPYTLLDKEFRDQVENLLKGS
ncbi:hypothetical protein [Oceanicoccus sp. KOV_DT_Chl]|uniref:hypothetical protein n=1 Tax=Oceanicoccus sp. KOV_DT_Chl TaxID=1904639 RepID=UPI000C797E67|nr:hypothetical protein [Oceanicoccus sp. KOV_DT_Chl]